MNIHWFLGEILIQHFVLKVEIPSSINVHIFSKYRSADTSTYKQLHTYMSICMETKQICLLIFRDNK